MSDLIRSLENSLDGRNRESLAALTLSVIAYVSGGITYLLPVLAILIAIDYLTGIIAAVIAGRQFSPGTAVRGAVKKAVYILFVIFAQLLDSVVVAVNYTGVIDIGNFHYLGFVVNIYLIGTECLSIAQNMADCGMPVPKPLIVFFKKIKKISKEK
ncbi:MAG: phage holin family protein [Treponema sp.]|jgi:toxin secretion/phage lysis holin|nr:phage holin family protein [Treponema sp.]